VADNTTLNATTVAGGDVIATEDVGGGVKLPVSKIYTGPHGTNGGPVTATNPFPTITDYASTAARTSIAAAISDTLVLAANAGRRGAFFYNDSDSAVHIGLGTVAVTLADCTVIVAAHTGWQLPFHFSGEVRAIWETATGSLRVTELT
jgi:hypothetical protein